MFRGDILSQANLTSRTSSFGVPPASLTSGTHACDFISPAETDTCGDTPAQPRDEATAPCFDGNTGTSSELSEALGFLLRLSEVRASGVGRRPDRSGSPSRSQATSEARRRRAVLDEAEKDVSIAAQKRGAGVFSSENRIREGTFTL